MKSEYTLNTPGNNNWSFGNIEYGYHYFYFLDKMFVSRGLRTFCVTILTVFVICHLNRASPVSIMKQGLCVVQQTSAIPFGSVCEGQGKETCFLKAEFPTIYVRCCIG